MELGPKGLRFNRSHWICFHWKSCCLFLKHSPPGPFERLRPLGEAAISSPSGNLIKMILGLHIRKIKVLPEDVAIGFGYEQLSPLRRFSDHIGATGARAQGQISQ